MFAALNLPIVEWLNGKYAFWVMILMYLWKNTGYSVILLLAGLVTVPAEQYESADLDGASAFQKSATSPRRKCGIPCFSP